jgi:Ca2+/Na+ antiporter
VPAGAIAEARGDVVVVGRLAGAARSRDPSSLIFALSVDPLTAQLTIAGSSADLVKSDAGKMTALVASRSGEGAIDIRPLPVSAAAEAASAAAAPTPAAAARQALSLAQQLAPVALGLAVVAAPATALSALSSVGGADGLVGSVVEAVLFGAIILQGAKLLSEGSELLLEVLDPGVVGGVLLPVLGATPDALIILSSGLGGTQAEAAQQLSVGVGTLAGSNALLLSPAWAAAVFAGRCDLDPATGVAIDRRLTVPLFGGGGGAGGGGDNNSNSSTSSTPKPKNPWTDTGVTVDPDVQRGAAVMAASVLLYGSVQLPAALLGDVNDPKAAAAGATACFLAGAAYCAYSVLSPSLQKRRIAEARKKRLRSLAAETLASRWLLQGAAGAGAASSSSSSSSSGPLLDASGKVRPAVADALFDEFDSDKSGHIDNAELRALLLGLQLAAGGSGGGQDAASDSSTTTTPRLDTKEAMDFFLADLDADGNASVSREEFASTLQRWVDAKLEGAAAAGRGGGGGSNNPVARASAWRSLLDPRSGGANAALVARLPEDDLEQLRRAADALATEEVEDEEDGSGEEGGEGGSRGAIIGKASAYLAGGLGLCAVFSDPLVEALSHLAEDLHADPFFVAFCLTPLASNASEVLSSLSFVSKKRRRNASLAFAGLFGGATINNTLILGILLAIISARQLPWIYSSETLAIAFVSAAVGVVAGTRTNLPLWTAVPVALVWPVTLAGVFYLDTVLGWT